MNSNFIFFFDGKTYLSTFNNLNDNFTIRVILEGKKLMTKYLFNIQ